MKFKKLLIVILGLSILFNLCIGVISYAVGDGDPNFDVSTKDITISSTGSASDLSGKTYVELKFDIKVVTMPTANTMIQALPDASKYGIFLDSSGNITYQKSGTGFVKIASKPLIAGNWYSVVLRAYTGSDWSMNQGSVYNEFVGDFGAGSEKLTFRTSMRNASTVPSIGNWVLKQDSNSANIYYKNVSRTLCDNPTITINMDNTKGSIVSNAKTINGIQYIDKVSAKFEITPVWGYVLDTVKLNDKLLSFDENNIVNVDVLENSILDVQFKEQNSVLDPPSVVNGDEWDVFWDAASGEWKNMDKTNVNREKAHTTYMSYDNIDAALEGAELGKRETAGGEKYHMSLNGDDWKFKLVLSPNDVNLPNPADSNFQTDGWGTTTVPSNWQNPNWTEQIKDTTDFPIYTNQEYPWRSRALGNTPAEWFSNTTDTILGRTGDKTKLIVPKNYNPVATYVKSVTLPQNWDGRQVFINFGGVESCLYLYVNGQLVAYNQNSYSSSSFDITSYLKSGVNQIAVRVYRWSGGSFFETQDFIRLSGIFRDVYLYSTPKTHIRDFKVDTVLDTDNVNATLNVRANIYDENGNQVNNCTFETRLYDYQNNLIGEPNNVSVNMENLKLKNDTTNFSYIKGDYLVNTTQYIANPKKWSAEYPNLYKAVFVLRDKDGNIVETTSSVVGFRNFVIKDGYIVTNGQYVKMLGANRHETDPDTGRYVKRERMLEDVLIMKSLNMNAVRTSHYPNDPYWYDLCNYYGLYVMDENNMETHGEYGILPQSDTNATINVVDRLDSMINRDKNQPSVVMYSFGNESNSGNAFYAMDARVKALDPTRVTHYEANSQSCDVESQMYTGASAIKAYAGTKPYIECEYAHAMGNSTGSLYDYRDAWESNKKLQGLFIWDLIDQSLYKNDTQTGEKYLTYGGAWGYGFPNSNFCANGIVTAERVLKPQANEIKYQYQKIWFETPIEDIKKGIVNIQNKFMFTNLSDFDVNWEVTDGVNTVANGNLGTIDLPAWGTTTVNIPIADVYNNMQAGCEYFLNFNVKYKQDKVPNWTNKDSIIAWQQFKLGEKSSLKVKLADFNNIVVNESTQDIVLSANNTQVTINKNGGASKSGFVTSFKTNDNELLDSPIIPSFYRATTDNETGYYGSTRTTVFNDYYTNAKNTTLKSIEVKKSDDLKMVEITANIDVGTTPVTNLTMVYTFYSNGDLHIDNTSTIGGVNALVPEMGMKCEVNKNFQNLTWLGREGETYWDRKLGSNVKLNQSTVGEQYFKYIRPQETGNHTDVRYMALLDNNGAGLMVMSPNKTDTLEFNASNYTPEALSTFITGNLYQYNLTKTDNTQLRILYHQTGVGGDNSWGAKPHADCQINKGNTYQYSFTLRGINSGVNIVDSAKSMVATPLPQFTSLTYRAELEKMSTQLTGINSKTYSEAQYSNGSIMIYSGGTTGSEVKFKVNLMPGKYSVNTAVRPYIDRGIMGIKINGVSLANTLDTYDSSSIQTITKQMGEFTISTQEDVEVTLYVVGKNASSSSYTLAVDYIDFIGTPLTNALVYNVVLDGNMLTGSVANLSQNAIGTEKLFIAGYDADGKLCNIKVKDINVGAGFANNVNFEQDIGDITDIKIIKVMMLKYSDLSIKPLANSCIVNIND